MHKGEADLIDGDCVEDNIILTLEASLLAEQLLTDNEDVDTINSVGIEHSQSPDVVSSLPAPVVPSAFEESSPASEVMPSSGSFS